jgi:VWFA-related protein
MAVNSSHLCRSTTGTSLQQRLVSAFSITALFLLSCFLSGSAALPVSAEQPKKENSQPRASIDLSLVGFHPLSASARLSTQVNMSLDFVDDDHVLLTFNPKKMFTRLPDCPPSHDDRVIQVVVLEVPSGKVVKEANWYLHDHQRYLWSLGSGRFLLRRLNSLYSVDSELHEKLLMTSPQPFLWIGVTGEGKQIISERMLDAEPAKSAPGAKAPKPKVQLDFLDIDTLAVQRSIKSEGKVQLDALSTGFADIIHSRVGKVWLVRFGPTGARRENITRVRSRCLPDVMFSSANTLLVGRCAMESPDYSVSAFTVTGHFLWRQHWSEHRYTPRLRLSDDGSRVAVSSVARVIVDRPSDSEDAGDDTDRGLKQDVEVLDTASGKSVLSLEVAPAALLAQNVSLSPGGRRLAVLQGSGLAVYDLAEMSPEDKAKYIAVKADVPGLYAIGSEPVAESEDEITFTSVDAAEATAEAEAGSQQALATRGTGAGDGSAATNPAPAAAQPLAAKSQPAASSARPNADTKTPSVTFKATSRIVVEDVVVADSKGHPVTGLRQGDFQLTEDGQPQNIRNFEEYPTPAAVTSEKGSAVTSDAGKVQTAQAASEAAKLPPNIFTNNRPMGPETSSSTIIVLDLLNTPLPDQQRAREHLIDFIKKRPAASQMALCSLSSNLRLIQGFTRDENLLLAAVKGKKGGVKAPPWQSDAGLEKSVQLARDLAAAAGAQDTLLALQRTQNTLDEQNAHDIDTRMRYTLDAFMQLARYLAGIPGRKNLVWLSGSFPLQIFPNPDVSEYEPATRNYEHDVKKATNLLAEAHVAVYPVSVMGGQTQTMFNAANNGTYDPRVLPGQQVPVNTHLANTDANLPLSSRMDREIREFREATESEHRTIDQVAAETGGKAFYGTNAIGDAIDSAVELGSHYYTLSYTPTNKQYDGRFRKIKVSLQKEGYHLAYRGGYYAQDPEEGFRDTRPPAQRIGVAAMQQGAPQSRQVVFTTRVVPIGKPKKVDAPQAGIAAGRKKKGAPVGPVEMQHYGIDYAVDPSDLRFGLTPSGLYHAVLGFMVTAFNDDGRLVASLESTTTSDLKPENYKEVMSGGFRLHQELDVPTEAVALRLGVEDATSNRVGTLEIGLPVPVPPEEPKIASRALPPIEPD